ncbi:MAG: endonuclease V [Myxococcales bacterium]|nr:endonuclease V [Myxococcales bacterium]
MQAKRTQDFPLDPTAAEEIQQRLAQEVQLIPGPQDARWIAAADVAYAKDSDIAYAALILYDMQTQNVVEEASWIGEPDFPYISGLFSLREAPLLLRAFEKLQQTPDALLIDGHGIAHPRRFGLASHIGWCLDLPTVGVSKTPFFGDHAPIGNKRGDTAPITDQGETIGFSLCTQDDIKPMYLSPGHLFDLETARDLVLRCCTRYRQPEPLREAHNFSVRLRA